MLRRTFASEGREGSAGRWTDGRVQATRWQDHSSQFSSHCDADTILILDFSWDQNDIELPSCCLRRSWWGWSTLECIRWWWIRSTERIWICGRACSGMSFSAEEELSSKVRLPSPLPSPPPDPHS